MSREDILRTLRVGILEKEPYLSMEDLRENASLTEELNLDSIQLIDLFSLIRSEIMDVELTGWLLRVASGEPDNLRGLVNFLMTTNQTGGIR